MKTKISFEYDEEEYATFSFLAQQKGLTPEEYLSQLIHTCLRNIGTSTIPRTSFPIPIIKDDIDAYKFFKEFGITAKVSIFNLLNVHNENDPIVKFIRTNFPEVYNEYWVNLDIIDNRVYNGIMNFDDQIKLHPNDPKTVEETTWEWFDRRILSKLKFYTLYPDVDVLKNNWQYIVNKEASFVITNLCKTDSHYVYRFIYLLEWENEINDPKDHEELRGWRLNPGKKNLIKILNES